MNSSSRTSQTQSRVLTPVEATELLKVWGIKVVESRLAHTQRQAMALAQELGFPVAVKIASPDIIRKQAAGGVCLNLKSQRQAREAYSQILQSVHRYNPQARIQGVIVQKMAPAGVEVVAGMSTDPRLGPIVKFGVRGATRGETGEDIALRPIPISPRDARRMLAKIQGYPALSGHGEGAPIDVAALEEILLDISQMAEMSPNIREVDIDPIIVYPQGAVAVDVRVVVIE